MSTHEVSRSYCFKEDLKNSREDAGKLRQAIEEFGKSLNVQKHTFYFRHVLEWQNIIYVRRQSGSAKILNECLTNLERFK